MRKTTFFLILIAFSSFAMGQEYFAEDFEAGTLPAGWSIITNATDGGYLFGTADELSNSFWPIPDNGGKIAVTNDKNCNCDKSNDILITSEFDLSNATTAFIGFDYKFDQYENQGILSVSYSLDGGTSWNGFSQVSQTAIPPTGASWQEYNLDASEITGESSVKLAFKYNDENKWNFGLALDNIKVFKPLQIDAAIEDLQIASKIKINTGAMIQGIIANYGSDTIKSAVVKWTDGKDIYSQSMTDLNIAPSTKYNFTHETMFTTPRTGNYTITVTVENPNGKDDENNENDSKSKEIEVFETTGRTVLIEEFSTEQCPNCPPVATYLDGIAEANENVIMMVHHAGYYTDPYTIPENEELLVFFNNGGRTFAPAGMMDRHYNGLGNDGSDANPGPVFWPGKPYGGTRIDDRLEQPTYTTVNFSGEYNEETKTVDVDITGSFTETFTENLGVSLWIIEDGIKSNNQSGYTGTWTHHSLVRDAISETFGNAITTPTNNGDEYSMSFSYEIDATWKTENLSLVAFVNTIDPGEVNNRTVHNSNAIELNRLTTLKGKDIIVKVIDLDGTIENAEIQVGSKSALTNEKGFATISFENNSGTVNYIVSKTSYLNNTGSFDLAVTDTITVTLTPEGESIVFKVTNADTAIVDAKIKVGTDSVLTNAEGFATLAFAETTGTFTYTITKENFDASTGSFDLAAEDTVKVTLVPTVGINDSKLNLVKFYPNPFSNTLTIDHLENASQVIVSNILGQAVLTINELDSKVVIPTSELNKGIYFISVFDNNNNVRTEKVIKQ